MSVDLLRDIERHLNRTGEPASTFGRRVCGDPRLVFDMRRGRRVGAVLAADAARYIETGRVPARTGGDADRTLLPEVEAFMRKHKLRVQDFVRVAGITYAAVTAWRDGAVPRRATALRARAAMANFTG